MAGTIHCVFQQKGGIGKTLAATVLAQYLRSIGRAVLPIDIDPVQSLSEFKALKAKSMSVVHENRIDRKLFDHLVAEIEAFDGDIVIDSGANSFLELLSYILEENVIPTLKGFGKELVIHTVVVGGQHNLKTLGGFKSIVEHFAHDASIVVWVNEHFGKVEIYGVPFEELPLFEECQDRVAGLVYLHRRARETFGVNVDMLLERKLTFDEALADSTLMTMDKQRIKQVRDSLYSQLAALYD